MFVSDLALNDYRSYREAVLSLPTGIVVFLGRNGRGKTNLIEAVAYLSTFSSHRVSADRALLRQVTEVDGQPGTVDQPSAAVIRARVNYGSESHRHSRLLELEIVQGKANRARMNRTPTAPKELLGELRTVLFAPEDLQLLRGDPGERRRFLDDIVTQLKPSFAGVRRDFDRVLRQRAAALKQLGRYPGMDSQMVQDSMAAWDQALAEHSAHITLHRQAVVQSMKPALIDYYRQVSGGDKIARMEYRSKLDEQRAKRGFEADPPLEGIPAIDGGYFGDLSSLVQPLRQQYLEMIEVYRADELRRTVNLVGAHRDDLDVSLQGLPVKGYASQGETWSMVLAMRLAEKDLLTTEEDTPVLILDDVFAELDEGRREALAESITSVDQVLITAAVESDLPRSLSGSLSRPLPVSIFHVDWDEAKGSSVSREADEEIGGKEVDG